MAKSRSRNNFTDREKNWNKIFTALVKLSQNLKQERVILEKKIKSLNGVICQMDLEKKVETVKMDFLFGLKDRENFVLKKKYEDVDDELADFREWFAYLSEKISEPKDAIEDGQGSRSKTLKDEVRRLKRELEECKTQKKSEITALLDEKKFVWNQFSQMENNLSEKLRKKSAEVELTNEKVQALMNRTEELQSSNERLRSDLTKIESDSVEKSQQISRLLKEIEVLKSTSESQTPKMRPCRAETGASRKEGKNRTRDRRVVTVKKESDHSHASEKMTRAKPTARKSTGGKAPRKQLCIKESSTSKRKAIDIITVPDNTPKLFTSSFKVPKLKHSSSPQVG